MASAEHLVLDLSNPDLRENSLLELSKLRKEGRRNEYEKHKLQALNQRQKMVLQRKTEEAAMATKRLKELLEARKSSVRDNLAMTNGNGVNGQVSKDNMFYMFGWPSAIGYEAVQFCKQHPEASWDILMYCLCGAIGQNFIFLTISRFGSLANTTITTTGKFVSIVVSSLLSGNPLSSKQWGCVGMVFSGLSYQIYLKWKKLQMPKKRANVKRD